MARFKRLGAVRVPDPQWVGRAVGPVERKPISARIYAENPESSAYCVGFRRLYTRDLYPSDHGPTGIRTGSTTQRYINEVVKAEIDGAPNSTVTRLPQQSDRDPKRNEMSSHYTYEKVERERELIEESERIDETAKSYLLEFHDEVSMRCGPGDRFGYAHAYTLVCHVRLLGERTDLLPGVIISEEDPEIQKSAKQAGRGLVRHIKTKFENEYTRDKKVGSLRVFIELVGSKDLIPDFSEVFQTNFSGKLNPTPAPGTILRWDDDIVPMLRISKNWRDRALIATQWSSGCRPMSEFHDLTYGQIVDRGDHFIITTSPDTKTGERDVRIFVGAPYLKRWLQHHPARAEDGLQADTPIWTKIRENCLLSYGQFGKIFNKAAERANISKPSYPQHYRASRASILASREHVTQPDLEVHFGWARGSTAAANYISRFATETAKHIAKADGVVVDEEFEDKEEPRNSVSIDTENDGPIAPVVCPNCEAWTPRHRETCLWCTTKITSGKPDRLGETRVTGTEEVEEARDEIIQKVTNGEINEEDINTMRDVERVLSEYPSLFDRIEQLLAYLNSGEDPDERG